MMETLRRFETKLDNAFIANIKQMFAVKLLANMAYSTNRSHKHPAFQKNFRRVIQNIFFKCFNKDFEYFRIFLK